MGHKKILAIISLILSIGIAPALPFADAERTQICIDKVWIENKKGKIACVTPSTAEKLVERGWGTLLEDISMEKPMKAMDSLLLLDSILQLKHILIRVGNSQMLS